MPFNPGADACPKINPKLTDPQLAIQANIGFVPPPKAFVKDPLKFDPIARLTRLEAVAPLNALAPIVQLLPKLKLTKAERFTL